MLRLRYADPTIETCQRPRICMDEMGKNLVKDKYPPEPAKPGQVAREDYTYEKKGSENLFIMRSEAQFLTCAVNAETQGPTVATGQCGSFT